MRGTCAFAALLRQAAIDRRADLLHQTFPAAEIRWLDGRMKLHRYHAGLDGESSLGHHIARAGDGDRNYGHAAFHREIERALLKRQELAIEGTLAFHVDGHIQALLHNLFRGAHGFNAGVAIAAIDRDQRSHAHRLPQDRNPEQLFFHQHRRTLRDEGNGYRRVKIRYVVGHEDIGPRRVESVEADGSYADAAKAHAIPCPDHEHAIEEANVAGDKRPGESDQSRHGQGECPEDQHCDSADHKLTDSPRREPAVSVRTELSAIAPRLSAMPSGALVVPC